MQQALFLGVSKLERWKLHTSLTHNCCAWNAKLSHMCWCLKQTFSCQGEKDRLQFKGNVAREELRPAIVILNHCCLTSSWQSKWLGAVGFPWRSKPGFWSQKTWMTLCLRPAIPYHLVARKRAKWTLWDCLLWQAGAVSATSVQRWWPHNIWCVAGHSESCHLVSADSDLYSLHSFVRAWTFVEIIWVGGESTWFLKVEISQLFCVQCSKLAAGLSCKALPEFHEGPRCRHCPWRSMSLMKEPIDFNWSWWRSCWQPLCPDLLTCKDFRLRQLSVSDESLQSVQPCHIFLQTTL